VKSDGDGACHETLPTISPGDVNPMYAAGQVTVGGSVSAKLITKLHESCRPAKSVAEHVTVREPKLKLVPMPGVQPKVLMPTLSVGTKSHVITLELFPASKTSFTVDGHETKGSWLSTTSTLKLHAAELEASSVAVHVMVVEPTGNELTPVCEHVTDTTPLLSVAVAGLHITVPVLAPSSVTVLIADGHWITGLVTSPMNTVNVHDAWLPEVSVALQRTVLEPDPKTLPDGTEHTTD
jgi:hypothetical protein